MKHLTPDSPASVTWSRDPWVLGVLCSLLFLRGHSVYLGEGPTSGGLLCWGRACASSFAAGRLRGGSGRIVEVLAQSLPLAKGPRGCQPQGSVGGRLYSWDEQPPPLPGCRGGALLRSARGVSATAPEAGTPRPAWLPFAPVGVFADAHSLGAWMIQVVGSTERARNRLQGCQVMEEAWPHGGYAGLQNLAAWRAHRPRPPCHACAQAGVHCAHVCTHMHTPL